jgi:Zn finger protein HypA/HybF involved in hydrogenase expression
MTENEVVVKCEELGQTMSDIYVELQQLKMSIEDFLEKLFPLVKRFKIEQEELLSGFTEKSPYRCLKCNCLVFREELYAITNNKYIERGRQREFINSEYKYICTNCNTVLGEE